MRDDGRFLIVKRSLDDTFLPGLWELPGGKSEETESPEDCTVRELKEETGLDVEIAMPFTAETFLHEKQQMCCEIFYVCKMKNQNQEVILSKEHSEYQWVNFYSLPYDGMSEYTQSAIHKAKKVVKTVQT